MQRNGGRCTVNKLCRSCSSLRLDQEVISWRSLMKPQYRSLYNSQITENNCVAMTRSFQVFTLLTIAGHPSPTLTLPAGFWATAGGAR